MSLLNQTTGKDPNNALNRGSAVELESVKEEDGVPVMMDVKELHCHNNHQD